MIFGYCASGAHVSEDPEIKGCPGQYQPFYFGTTPKEKNTRIPNGEIRLCSCKCHGSVETTTKKPRGRPRKK